MGAPLERVCPTTNRSRLADWIRYLMMTAGALALAGLSGVVVGDMRLRNVGILGCVGVFLVVAVTAPSEA